MRFSYDGLLEGVKWSFGMGYRQLQLGFKGGTVWSWSLEALIEFEEKKRRGKKLGHEEEEKKRAETRGI